MTTNSFQKEKESRRLIAAGLLILAISVMLNVRADDSPPDGTPEQLEREAQQVGLNPAQYNIFMNQLKELQSDFGSATKSAAEASRFQAIVTKAITNIDAASTPIIPNGNNLPSSFTDRYCPVIPSSVAKADEIKAGFMGLGPDKLIDQFTLMGAGVFIDSAPDILIPVLQERANILPPSAADYILYAGVVAALDGNNYDLIGPNGGYLPLSRSVGLLTLAQARNPIYRFLAVRAAFEVESDDTKRLKFYSEFLNETDPYILRFAVNGVSRTKTPAAISVLQSFKPAVQKTGDAKLMAHLQELIARPQK